MKYKDGAKIQTGHTVTGTVDGKEISGVVVGVHWDGKSNDCLFCISSEGRIVADLKSSDFIQKSESKTVASPAVAKTGNAPGA
jgi:hypothetical protein